MTIVKELGTALLIAETGNKKLYQWAIGEKIDKTKVALIYKDGFEEDMKRLPVSFESYISKDYYSEWNLINNPILN